jgi:hypothetical protein
MNDVFYYYVSFNMFFRIDFLVILKLGFAI